MSMSSSYNPTAVISAAHAKSSAGDWEGGQFLFQSSLLEWTDDAREAAGSLDDAAAAINIPEQQREAVATLWLAYAQYLVDGKQYKSATQAYADAVSSVVAGRVGRVHAAAARYALERNQRQTALRIYKNALQGDIMNSNSNEGGHTVDDEQDRELLWNDFLEMMRVSKPDLTMTELRQKVASDSLNSNTIAAASTAQSQPPSKRLKTSSFDGDDAMEVEPGHSSSRTHTPVPPPLHTNPAESKTHVVTIESVQELKTQLVDQLLFHTASGGATATSKKNKDTTNNRLPPDVTAAWMSRDGHSQPVEPPAPALFRPSPPKLSDPTSKDVLGIDLAVELVQCLLGSSGDIVLQVCRALWMLQAWTEHSCRTKLEAHDAALVAQHERLEGEWEARYATVAYGTQASTAKAVADMNEQERQRFQWQAQEQRLNVIAQTVWDMRQLLYWQQSALAKLHVPGFDDDGITSMIDAESLLQQSLICQYLHSAFFIRNRMGSEPHCTMLKSQLKKLLREQDGYRSGAHSPKTMVMIAQPQSQHGGGGLPPMYPPPQHQQQQQRQQYRGLSPVPPPQPGSYNGAVAASGGGVGGGGMIQGTPPQGYNQYPPQMQQQMQAPPPMMQQQQQQPYGQQQQQQGMYAPNAHHNMQMMQQTPQQPMYQMPYGQQQQAPNQQGPSQPQYGATPPPQYPYYQQ